MKKIQILILALAMLGNNISEADQYDMTLVNQKVQAVVDEGLHNINTAIDVKTLTDSPEFVALKQKCLADWQGISGNIESSGNGDTGKRLVFLGCSYLPAADYMTFMETIVGKYSADLVTDPAMKDLLFNEGQMGAFIVDNFSHARVIAVLNTIKNKTADNAFKQRLEGILDGSAKAALDDFRVGHEGLPEGNIPVVILGA